MTSKGSGYRAPSASPIAPRRAFPLPRPQPSWLEQKAQGPADGMEMGSVASSSASRPPDERDAPAARVRSRSADAGSSTGGHSMLSNTPTSGHNTSRCAPSATFDIGTHYRRGHVSPGGSWWEVSPPARHATVSDSVTGDSSGGGGCATTGTSLVPHQRNPSWFEKAPACDAVDVPYVVAMLPPSAFKRRRAYALLLEESVATYMYALCTV